MTAKEPYRKITPPRTLKELSGYNALKAAVRIIMDEYKAEHVADMLEVEEFAVKQAVLAVELAARYPAQVLECKELIEDAYRRTRKGDDQ